MKDELPFAMAGLWENWQDPTSKEWMRTFTITTCPPNALMSRIHDRMPVILQRDDYAKWLGESPATPDELQALLKPYPPEPMKMWPVTTRMNSARYQETDSIDPIDDDPLNPG